MAKRRFLTLFRYLIIVATVLALVAFIAPIGVGVLNIGNVLGIGASVIVLAASIWHKRVGAIRNRCRETKSGRVALQILAVLLAVAILLVLLLTAFMVAGANKRTDEDATVVVLGCAVNGEEPSRMLAARLDAAYAYLVEHPQAVAILTGGLGTGDTITESECMYRYLTAKGISPDRLYKEERSTSTHENLAYSKEIVEQNGLQKRMLLVTNEFHEYRAIYIAGKMDLEAYALSVPSVLGLLPTYYVREMLAILYEWFVAEL